MDKEVRSKAILNGICPYFTMFPLEFPYSILCRYSASNEWVMDPFCGRGTTNYASRLLGLPSIGIDSSPVATAISQAKLANTSPQHIARVAQRLLDEIPEPSDVPEGEFWQLAFHEDVLHTLCRLREGLLFNCHSDARIALRAILMGALHGPRPKSQASYFSNQCQRTYAPKPRYAIEFWKAKNMAPQPVNIIGIINKRAVRYYTGQRRAAGKVVHGDSRDTRSYASVMPSKVRWIITSPPYYGMRTYIPDQWLRSWFLGGDPIVDYSSEGQVKHSSPEVFAQQLGQVWRNVGAVCTPDAQLIIRFGGINDRQVDPLLIVKQSLKDTGWLVKAVQSAGVASKGRRQAAHFSGRTTKAIEEHDVWATWEG